RAKAALQTLLGGRTHPVLRIVASGSGAGAVMALPWELVRVGSEFPVETGRLHVVREVRAPGAEDGPAEPEELRLLAHIAAPEGADPKGREVAPLELEDAAWRMARALDRLADRAAVRWNDLGTLEHLAKGVTEHRPTLLHFAGHGSPGHLVLEDHEG